ncbi:MAG TPA: DsbA family protein [Candidatus Binatia bacterium]|nr:DsbA family protein [Candidatus Binatia bacterium]
MRLRHIEEEMAGDVRVEWRSFLLRPKPDPGRTLEQFRAYTRSWLRPAAEPDAGTFRVWEGHAGPPSHSVPPHLVAKAAGSLGDDAFHRMHDRLLHAYFAESRDVTDPDTLATLWTEAGLPEAEFARVADPEWLRRTIDEHNEAVRLGVNGVPAVRVEGDEAFVTGAYPLDMYRRWVRRLLDGPPAGAS